MKKPFQLGGKAGWSFWVKVFLSIKKGETDKNKKKKKKKKKKNSKNKIFLKKKIIINHFAIHPPPKGRGLLAKKI